VSYITYHENYPLKVASYYTVSFFKIKAKKLPTGIYFNKILSLAHHELKEEGIRINLPHVWYRYGDEVVRYHMPYELDWNHERENLTTVNWKGKHLTLAPSDDYSRRIMEKIETLTHKYYNDFKGIVEKNYSYAPFQFQKDFLKIREMFYGVRDAFNFDLKTLNTLSKPTLEKMFANFPISEFPILNDEYSIAMALKEILLEDNNPDLNIFQEFSVAFWFMFCYCLRTHKKASENVPRKTVEFWRSKIPFQKEKYRGHFADLIIEYAKSNPKISECEILKTEIDWRKEELETIDKLVDEFVDSLEEVGDFKCQYRVAR